MAGGIANPQDVRSSRVHKSSSCARHPVAPRIVNSVHITVTSTILSDFTRADRLITINIGNEANKGSLFVTAYTIANTGT